MGTPFHLQDSRSSCWHAKHLSYVIQLCRNLLTWPKKAHKDAFTSKSQNLVGAVGFGLYPGLLRSFPVGQGCGRGCYVKLASFFEELPFPSHPDGRMLRAAALLLTTLASVSAVSYPNLQPGAQIKLSSSALNYSGQLVQVRTAAEI